MQDPRRTGPRERISRIIQMNLDSPLKLCAAFKRAFGALLVLENKEYLEVSLTSYRHAPTPSGSNIALHVWVPSMIELCRPMVLETEC